MCVKLPCIVSYVTPSPLTTSPAFAQAKSKQALTGQPLGLADDVRGSIFRSLDFFPSAKLATLTSENPQIYRSIRKSRVSISRVSVGRDGMYQLKWSHILPRRLLSLAFIMRR